MKKDLLQKIDEELKRIYHNATIRGELRTESDYESDLYDSEFEIQRDIAFSDLKYEFSELIKHFGEPYQYGRGGRTVCLSKLHRDSRYACAIHSSETLELERWSNEDLIWLAQELTRFNDCVIGFCTSIQDHIIEYIREEHAQDIELNKNKKRKIKKVVSYE